MWIKNVQVVNFDQIIPNADVEITNHKISQVIPRPGQAKLLLVPGFIDLHIHGYNGNDVMDSKQAVSEISRDLKSVGVTAFAPTVMTGSWVTLKRALSDVATAPYPGAKFAGTHLEGPFISLAKKGAHDPQFIMAPTSDKLRELSEASHHTIKILTLSPETWLPEHFKTLSTLGIEASLGHTNASYAEAATAFNHGAIFATHLWNAMSGVENRKPGVATAALLDERVYTEMICDLIHIDEATMRLSIKLKTPRKVIAVTDALKAAGTPDGYSESGGLTVEKHGIKITLKGTDTLAGSGASMIDNFRNLVKLGYALNDVVAMTSTNAAHSLRLKMGQIRLGFPADLVLLNPDLTIAHVYVDGQ